MDPYKNGMDPDEYYHMRRTLIGEIVCVMRNSVNKRGILLIDQPTRALRQYEIVELIATEETITNDKVINSISYVGFIEIKSGGVVKKGDTLFVGDRGIGKVLGYDETHMPNHLNLIVETKNRKTGLELGIQLNDVVTINVY